MSHPNFENDHKFVKRGTSASLPVAKLPPMEGDDDDDEMWDLADMKASFFIGENEKIMIIGADEKEIDRDEVLVAPDGGWGWWVVFASFMSNMVIDGIIYSFGVFLEPIRTASDQKLSVSTITWVGSLLPGFYLMSGPLASFFSNKYGFRTVALFGSVLAGLGFLGAYLCNFSGRPNIISLFILYGVVGGIGFGFMYIPSIVTVGFYFEKRRALATGIAICGSGIGTFVFAPLNSFLIHSLGWHNAILAQSGIVFFTIFFGLFYIPLSKSEEMSQTKKKKKKTADEAKAIAKLRGAQTVTPSPEGTPLMIRLKRARDMEKWETDSISTMGDSVRGVEIIGANNTMLSVNKQKVDSSEPKPKPTTNSVAVASNNAKTITKTEGDKSSTHSLKNLQTSGPHPSKHKRRGSAPSVRTNIGSTADATASGDNVTVPHRTQSSPAHTAHSQAQNQTQPPTAPIVLPQRGQGMRNKSFVGLPDLKEIAEEANSDEIQPIMEEKEGELMEQIIADLPRAVSATTNFHENPDNRSQLNRNSTVLTIAHIGHSILTMDEGNRSKILRVESTNAFVNKPLYRDDIFYGGSMSHVPDYVENLEGDHPLFSSKEWAVVMSRVPFDTKKMKKRFGFIRKMLDFSLLLSPTFFLLAISGTVMMLGLFVPFMYLSGVASEAMENGNKTAALKLKETDFKINFLVAQIGISNVVGRIFCGWAADRPWVNALFVNNLALTIGGIVTLALPSFRIYPLFAMYSCIFGLSLACFVTLRSIIIVEFLGLPALTNAFGLSCLFQGFAALIGAPIAGFLYDVTGSYDASFYVSGSLILLSGILCYPLHYVNRWEKGKANKKHPNPNETNTNTTTKA